MISYRLATILGLSAAVYARSVVRNSERAVHLTGFSAASASQTFADEKGVADVGKIRAEGDRLVAKYAARRGAKGPNRAAFKGKRALSTNPVNNYGGAAYAANLGVGTPPQQINSFNDLGQGSYFDRTASSPFAIEHGLIRDGQPTIIQSLITSHSLSINQFSLFLSTVTSGSEITIGSVNKARFSKLLATYPVSSPDAYAGVKGAKLNAAGSSATQDVYQYPCNSRSAIGFSFHGDTRIFDVAAADLNMGTYHQRHYSLPTSSIKSHALDYSSFDARRSALEQHALAVKQEERRVAEEAVLRHRQQKLSKERLDHQQAAFVERLVQRRVEEEVARAIEQQRRDVAHAIAVRAKVEQERKDIKEYLAVKAAVELRREHVAAAQLLEHHRRRVAQAQAQAQTQAQANFIPPTPLVFRPSPPSSSNDDSVPARTPEPTLAYSTSNATFLAYEDHLVTLLSKIDEIASGGDPIVKEARKKLVGKVESELRKLDEIKAVEWNKAQGVSEAEGQTARPPHLPKTKTS
ncbi:hypothetical protein RQP46_008247 [Phenoliferia psychrophenolica]